MEKARTIANISRTAGVPIQNMHHYISKSPWSGPRLLEQVRLDIVTHPHFECGSMLIGDESADARQSEIAAGSGRQYNGRLGKVDLCQVGVFLSITKNGQHNWLDGELFLPESWFDEEQKEPRNRIGLPTERKFQTKPELFWQMLQRAQAQGVAFDAVAVDALYGQCFWLRDKMDKVGIEFYADVPANTRVYLSEPKIGIPRNKRGPKATKPRVLSPFSYLVRDLPTHPTLFWQTIRIRTTERGWLDADFARIQVWTVQDDMTLSHQWLLIRKAGKKHSYTFSNASSHIPLKLMAFRKTQRFFIECDNRDAKSEFGWDEIQTISFNAWEHQLAFTILAQWFINATRLDWQHEYDRDPDLLDHYLVDILPSLSVANIRELLRSALPLPSLSTLEAALLVISHLDNRTRSRKSRTLHLAEP